MLRGWVVGKVVENERPVATPGARPAVSALLCGVLAGVSGVWASSVGLLVFAAICVFIAWSTWTLRPPFNATPTRRLLSVAPFAALGPTMAMAIVHLTPDACARLAPGVFILIWPLVVAACVVGARTAVATARAEGWSRFGAHTIPALWGVLAGALAIHLLSASAWSCGGGALGWGLWWFAGSVSALALAARATARGKGGV